MNIRPAFNALRAAIVLAIIPALAYAAQGDLMSITSHMTMTGVPNMMPHAVTIQRCVAPGAMTQPQTYSRRNHDCTVSDLKRTASSVSAHLVCPNTTADIHMQIAGSSTHGTMHMVTTAGGSPMTMDETFDAKRIGSCDYHAK